MTDAKRPPPAAERPRCPTCDKPLRPVMASAWERVEAPPMEIRQFRQGRAVVVGVKHGHVERKVEGSHAWTGHYSGYGVFCTLKCCAAFANAAYRAGYRLKGTAR